MNEKLGMLTVGILLGIYLEGWSKVMIYYYSYAGFYE
jgi:hypothetical protein